MLHLFPECGNTDMSVWNGLKFLPNLQEMSSWEQQYYILEIYIKYSRLQCIQTMIHTGYKTTVDGVFIYIIFQLIT